MSLAQFSLGRTMPKEKTIAFLFTQVNFTFDELIQNKLTYEQSSPSNTTSRTHVRFHTKRKSLFARWTERCAANCYEGTRRIAPVAENANNTHGTRKFQRLETTKMHVFYTIGYDYISFLVCSIDYDCSENCNRLRLTITQCLFAWQLRTVYQWKIWTDWKPFPSIVSQLAFMARRSKKVSCDLSCPLL